MTYRASQPWTVIGVPIDSVGSPDGGPPFGTELSPAALRSHGLVERLGARDAGDLPVRITGSQRDPVSGLVGGATVAPVVSAVRAAVADVVRGGTRPLVLGGCCTLLAGAFPGAVDAGGPLGLAYVDGHLDLYDHRTSPTGEVADMPVALLLGIGEPGLLAACGPERLAAERLRVIGAHDTDEARDLAGLAAELGVVQVDVPEIAADPEAAGRRVVDDLDGPYWLSLDVDVLDQEAFPSTDYLMSGGLDLEQLHALMAPLGHDERLAGVSIGCYNPTKDPTGEHGRALVDLLVDVLGGAR